MQGYGGLQRRLYELAVGLTRNGRRVLLYAPPLSHWEYPKGIELAWPSLLPIAETVDLQAIDRLDLQARSAAYAKRALDSIASRTDIIAILYSFYDQYFIDRIRQVFPCGTVVAMLGNASCVPQRQYPRDHLITFLSRAHQRSHGLDQSVVVRPSTECVLPGHDGLPLTQSCRSPNYRLLGELRAQGRDYLCMIAGVSAFKGQRTAIAIARSSLLPLVIVGPVLAKSISARFEEYYRNLSAEIDGSNVIFVGEQCEHIKNEVLAYSFAHVWPAGMEDTTWVEPYGRAVAEAIRLGTPVVAHGFGGHTEIIENGCTGTLFDDLPSASAALKAALRIPRPVRSSSGVIRTATEYAMEYVSLVESGDFL